MATERSAGKLTTRRYSAEEKLAAGLVLIAETTDRLGLTSALDREPEDLFERSPKHSPGRVLRDLAVMLADGGDALSDLATVRDQEAQFGPVASNSTAFRLIERIASEPDGLERLRVARAEARARAWRRGARPRLIEIDSDATLTVAHSDKEGAAGTFKAGFGFHPMLAYLDGSEEALAGMLRPGNAGANTAADQIAVLDAALAQLPKGVAAREAILVRADRAGATHELLDFCRDGNLRFSVGSTSPRRSGPRSSTATRPSGSRPSPRTASHATRAPGSPRYTDGLDPSGCPAGSRVLVRREIPHPGAQLSFTDCDGHRFQAILTDQPDTDIAYLEARHRGRRASRTASRTARTPAWPSCRSATSLTTPSGWRSPLIAYYLIAHTKALVGDLACAPKRLRYRLLHVAGRLAFHARQAILHLDRDWPWAQNSPPPSRAWRRSRHPRADSAPAHPRRPLRPNAEARRPRHRSRTADVPAPTRPGPAARPAARATNGLRQPITHSPERARLTVIRLMQDPG